MILKQITPPTLEPVTRAELNLHARISDPSQWDRVDRYIASARSYAENRLGRQLVNATWRLSLDSFPNAVRWDARPNTSNTTCFVPNDYRLILLPKPPLVSVSWIKYYAVDGTLTTLDSTLYNVDTDSEPGRIQLKWTASWPTTDDRIGAVQIQFVAGYGADPADVPADIKHAIETIAAHAYENREAVMETDRGIQLVRVPLLGDELLDLHRVQMYLY